MSAPTEMVERIARALAAVEYGDGHEEPWEPFICHANAALATTLPPTFGMILAGENAWHEWADHHPQEYIFEAMIRAAQGIPVLEEDAHNPRSPSRTSTVGEMVARIGALYTKASFLVKHSKGLVNAPGSRPLLRVCGFDINTREFQDEDRLPIDCLIAVREIVNAWPAIADLLERLTREDGAGEVREALEPFARAASRIPARYDDDRAVMVTIDCRPTDERNGRPDIPDGATSAKLIVSFDGISAGHFRRAAAAIALPDANGGDHGK